MRVRWLHGMIFLVACPSLGLAQPARSDPFGDPLPEGISARLGPLRFRHDGNVHALLYSPDGKLLAGQIAHDVFLWEASTGRLLHRLGGAVNPCPRDFISPAQYRVCLWLRAFDFTPDGKALAAVDCKKGIGVWDTSTGRLLRRLPVPGKADFGAVLRCCPDGKSLAVVTEDGPLCLLEASGGKILWEKKLRRKHRVFALAFTPDGKRLALNGPDTGVQLWETASGKLLRRIEEKGERYVHCLAFSADGATLAVSRLGTIVLSETATGRERTRLTLGPKEELSREEVAPALAFAPSGEELVSCRLSGKAHVWSLATRQARCIGSGGRLMGDGFGKPTLAAMALSPDGKTLALGDLSTVLSLFDLATGKRRFAQFQGHKAAIGHLAFLRDGKMLVSGDTEADSLLLWDTRRGKLLRRLPVPALHFAASRDGCRIVALASPRDDDWGRIGAHVWDPLRNVKLADLPLDDRDRNLATSLRQVAFAAGGKRVIGLGIQEEGNRGVLLAWDSRKGTLLDRLLLPALHDADVHVDEDWTPDSVLGERAALLHSTAGLLVCDLERVKVCYTLGRGQLLSPVALSPDDRVALCYDGEGTLRSWELLSGRQIRPPAEPRDPTRGLEVVSPDGRLAAACEWADPVDRGLPLTVHVWDLLEKRRLARRKVAESNPDRLCFSPDGTRLALGLGNGSILIWDLPPVPPRRGRPQPLTARQLQACWTDLASADPGPAYQAIARLAASPQEAMPFLQERLRPAAVDARQVRLLIAELDSGSYEVRQSATAKLQTQIDLAEAFLRDELARGPAEEARERIRRLLAKVDAPVTDGEALRRLRSLAVLEQMADAQAPALLRRLAGGAPEARLTREAKATLERLAATGR